MLSDARKMALTMESLKVDVPAYLRTIAESNELCSKCWFMWALYSAFVHRPDTLEEEMEVFHLLPAPEAIRFAVAGGKKEGWACHEHYGLNPKA